jgi:methionine-S-sulfoxide reductase
MKTIVLGSGCFWCGEAVFQQVEGVESVIPGYAGGQTPDPTYEAVCTGETGHAEVFRLTYDENVLTLEEILNIFFLTHDPTSLNRQGNDVGTQYRSAVYYESDEDAKVVRDVITQLQQRTDAPIVTEVAPLDTFYEAEEYHHNYFQKHPYQAYCVAVINPKLDKLRSYLQGKSEK